MQLLNTIFSSKSTFEVANHREPDTLLVSPEMWRGLKADIEAYFWTTKPDMLYNKKELFGMKIVESRDVEQYEVAYVGRK